MSDISQQNDNTAKIEKLSFVQKQRLTFIDFCLLFRGSINRKQLTHKFEMGMANATRDLALYKELAPHNIDFNAQERTYHQSPTFKALFTHGTSQTLAKLANDINEGFDGVMDTAFSIDAPSQLNMPDIYVVAKLVQAILNNKAVEVDYTSLSSGLRRRELVPHSIVDSGLRWHVRAFDRKSQSFRDFVLTRISKAEILATEPSKDESKLEDHQWMRVMPLQLVPHPNNVKHSSAIEMDYGMNKGKLEINVRAALAGYLLRRWNVDCTEDASLQGGEYQLWLQNRQTLYGAENLAIAPGYQAI